jgi:O-glycosyl hydrolase
VGLWGRQVALIAAVSLATAGCGSGPISPPPPGSCSLAGAPVPSSAVVVSVDPMQRYQVLDGFGTSTRLFDDPHLTEIADPATGRSAVLIPAAEQQRILAALYGELGLTRARYATDPGVELVNDNDDPGVTDLSMFNFAWKRADGHIDYVKSARPLGLTTWFGSPIFLEAWMSRSDPAEYVEWAFAIIQRWRDLGATLPYWSIDNEPGGQGGLGTQFLREAVKGLGARLAAAGIATRIVIPDDVNPARALTNAQVILSDPVARPHVAALAFHLYGGADGERLPNTTSLPGLVALAKQYNLPLWMTEWYTRDWFVWATTMHDMLASYDVSAVDYLWAFFGQWEGLSAELITINYNGSAYIGFTKNRQYWVMGQYSAFIRPGAVRIAASSSGPNVLVTAWLDGPKVTVVAINTGPSATVVRFDLGAGSPCIATVGGVRTSDSESGVVLPVQQVQYPRFVATLPHGSITTFVAQ